MSRDERFHSVYRSGGQNVSGGRISIAVVMKLTAIIAVNLALIRAGLVALGDYSPKAPTDPDVPFKASGSSSHDFATPLSRP
jgi:hypothetical protein